ncbi:MAG: phage terminase large subunit family protein [Steroidobacteraceae bacterium]|nr:phage terminase large subunit family protein [Steroidobacteraceae bacterium]
MDLSEIARLAEAEADRRLQRGMSAWAVPEPMTLDEWAQSHFYLSAESSYVEQRWTPWTFQRAIMACISNDDIYEIDLKKSARVGYTKILLAAVGYFAHHKRRNQALWQPTDEDRDEFVKTELDPMLRDVPVMRDVLPSYVSRHKDNTLQAKKFIGSMLHTKGAKAAKNFRRISVDVAELDEVDAMDRDVEKEGDPFTLAAKRVEGATFPKVIVGSTPKLKGFSLIDERYTLADERFAFQIPCPHCGERHALTWGGKDEPHGLKFTDRDPETARHLCPHCGTLIAHGEYLAVESQGVWINESGTMWLHADGRFTTPEGDVLAPPRHIAFHVWTAYSPAVSWAQIVREFLAAREAMERGDETKMKAWTNTTRGECWEGEIERTDADELKQRAEPFKLRVLPRDCLLLLCGADTQGNRLEAQVWGLGIGGQMWTIDHRVFFGNPAQEDVWLEFEEFILGETYQHASGTTQRIYATALDSGGHHADAVYAFAHKHRTRRVYAVKGSSGAERSIENGNTKVGFNWQGKREKQGPTLWHVGTNLAKDRLAARLEVSQPGPGYVHLSADNTDEWFRQLAAEDRVTVRTQAGTQSRWTPNRKRNEVIDMTAYAIWLEERLDLWAPKRKRWWAELEEAVQPAITDLFSGELEAAPVRAPVQMSVQQSPVPVPRAVPQNPIRIAHSDWSSRL